jgi:choline dehydrogenase-like flavoprotein
MATPDVIVGSGLAGAVTTATLALHGLRVLVLEGGGPWSGRACADHPPRDGRDFPRAGLGVRKLVRGG